MASFSGTMLDGWKGISVGDIKRDKCELCGKKGAAKLGHRAVMIRSPTQGYFQFSGFNVHSNCFYDARDQLEAGADVKWSKFGASPDSSDCQFGRSNRVTEKTTEDIETLKSSDEMKNCTPKKHVSQGEADQRPDWWTHNPCVEIIPENEKSNVAEK